MRRCFLLGVCMLLAGRAFCQQITRFGVVDTSRVYQAYFRNSAPMRNYEAKKAEFQAEINRLTEELQRLNQQKLEQQNSGNESAALRMEADITKKADYLKEYAATKNMELESLRKSLQNSDAFYKKLYSTLERIAESGGYSMILSLQNDNSILWYSPSVDVTDEVISMLGL